MIKDFSSTTRFPGTETSLFDTLVRLGDLVEKIPALIFAAILCLLAFGPALGNISSAIGLYIFFVSDWALLAALPRAGKSFGPAQPPTLLLALLRCLPAFFPMPFNLGAQLLGTGLILYGFWIEPHHIRVTQQTLTSEKVSSSAAPLRVLHLGDLHIERITHREREVARLASELQPDLILFSGDFLNLSNVHDPVAWEHARTLLRGLSAPLGVYVVTGSPPVDKPEVIRQVLDGLDHIRWLRNERISLDYRGQTIDILGITCTHQPAKDRVILDDILRGDPDNFTILLYHSPDLAPHAAEQGVDLQLSGHTHGGQVRLPFWGALYTSSLYGKRFDMGRYAIRDFTLYVTRGIGLEGKGAPRVRFMCPPEVTLWEISG